MPTVTHLHRSLILSILLLARVLSAEDSVLFKEYDCVIIPSNVADLGSNARGIIDRVLVDRNDFVKRGDAIAVLDDSVERAVFELARQQASLTSEIELRQAYMEHTAKEQKRAEKAFNGKAYSQQAVDLAKIEARQAKIRLLQAKENQNLAQKELERAKASLARRTIRAPFSGIVTERFKAAGEYLESEAVVRLARLDPLHVEVIVPASQQGQVKRGMLGKVGLKAQDWEATVSQVDRVMDAASGTFGVRLSLPNPEYAITAGVRCRVHFSPAPLPQKVLAVEKNIPKVDKVTPLRVENPPEKSGTDKVILAIAEKREQVPTQKSAQEGCERLGPYKDKAAADVVISSLKAKGQSAASDERRWMKLMGYRVVSDILRSGSEKDAFIVTLKRAGVKEYFALHQIGGVERISLGAFAKEDAAQRYKETLAKKGVITQLDPWRKETSSFWVRTGCESKLE